MLAAAVLRPAAAPAQETLTCGVPVLHTLAPGGTDTYHIAAQPGAVVVIQSSALTAALGRRLMRLTGPGFPTLSQSSGIIRFTGPPTDLSLDVSQLSGNTGGTYTLTLNVVSGGPANCGLPLDCGATPDGVGLVVPGEVDSFRMDLVGGQPTKLRANYLAEDPPDEGGVPFLAVFDPSGTKIVEQCAGTLDFNPASTGTYTVLVSSCSGQSVQLDYRLELFHAGCPVGPTITYFGIADAGGNPLPPIGFDAAWRAIFNQEFGTGVRVVVEARSGATHLRVGDSAVPYSDAGVPEDADLQVILSRPLGDGDPAICDVAPPMLGGVAATVPLVFDDSPTTLDHIHDLGCRFDNGQGSPLGQRVSTFACTRTLEDEFLFVDQGSAIQFCTTAFGNAWEFLDGDTIVAARAKDSGGNFGAPREIVVRIGPANPITPTPTVTTTSATPTRTATPTSTTPPATIATRTDTPTRTVTRTRTVSPTPTGPTPTITATRSPGGACPGDCGGNGVVTVDEITLMLNIALGQARLDECMAGDVDQNGAIGISDLVVAVNSLLNGCP